MKNFYDLYFEMSEDQKKQAKNFGYEFLDEIITPEMEFFLLFGSLYPTGLQYHLAAQAKDANVFSLNQQMDRKQVKDKSKERYASGDKYNFVGMLNSLKSVENKIKEWINQYGPLTLASTNEQLTEKWKKSLEFLSNDFKIEKSKTEIMGHRLYQVSL